MKRLWIAAGIVFVIAAACVVGGSVLRSNSQKIIEKIEQAKVYAINGDMPAAAEAAREAEAMWVKTEHVISLFIDQRHTDEAGAIISRLPALADDATKEAFISECSGIIVYITHIVKNESFDVFNMF